jgi:UDP-N-acetylmuramate--alanine ligase
VTGDHNKLNASAAFNLGLNLEISPEKLRTSLKSFPGIGRRMELLTEINGAPIFSDFAHHPTAIKVATNQIKKTYPDKKIHIIYQPHMFSRTKALFKEFTEVFKNLEVEDVAMLNIYPSREKDIGLIRTQDLVDAVNKENIKSAESIKQVWNKIKPTLSSEDVVIFMGAGDIDIEIRKLLRDFSE